MKIFEKLSVIGTAFLMTVSMGAAYAEQVEPTQTGSQERVRTELNLQTPASEAGQSRFREEHTVMNENKNQYQYKNMNRFNKGNTGSAGDSGKSQNAGYNIWQGHTAASNMNTTNRNSTASRAMGGARR